MQFDDSWKQLLVLWMRQPTIIFFKYVMQAKQSGYKYLSSVAFLPQADNPTPFYVSEERSGSSS